MTDTTQRKRDRDLSLLQQVDDLNEQVKTLALNLALYLAKARAEGDAPELHRMEPEFIRLVNHTVRVVQELTVILNAAQNKETMVFEVPSGRQSLDRIEYGLRAILEQCSRVMETLSRVRNVTTGGTAEPERQ
jgi:hypothetical protein